MVCLFHWHSFDACMKIHDVLAKTGLFLLTLREGGRTPPFLNPYKQLEVYEKTISLNLLLSAGVFFLSDSSWTSGSLVWLRFRFSMLSISWRTSSTVLCLPKGKHQNLSYNMYFSEHNTIQCSVSNSHNALFIWNIWIQFMTGFMIWELS